MQTALLLSLCLAGPMLPQKGPVSQAFIKEALAYRKMTALHKERVEMEKVTAALCAPASQVYGPHYRPYIRTYVTASTLSKPLPQKGQLDLPVGTMLVKEKYESSTAKSPSVITAMKKTSKGLGSGFWEFGMIDLKSKKEVRTPAMPCVSCHSKWKENDGLSYQSASLMRHYKSTLVSAKK